MECVAPESEPRSHGDAAELRWRVDRDNLEAGDHRRQVDPEEVLQSLGHPAARDHPTLLAPELK